MHVNTSRSPPPLAPLSPRNHAPRYTAVPPHAPEAAPWPPPTLQFLHLIEFNVTITASLYASYYFKLRTLCEKAEREFSLKPLSEERQRELESKSSAWGWELQKKRRWSSGPVPECF